MGRRKVGEENIRKIMKTGREGGTYIISIPINIINDLDWREKQKVVVEQEGKKIVIKDWKP